MKRISSFLIGTALALVPAVTAQAAHTVLFDNMSKYEMASTNVAVTATGSTPNTFMGMGVDLLPTAAYISGFDLFPVNISGSNFTSLKITIYVWNDVNTSGTVNSTTPAFGNLMATYSVTANGSFNTGFFYNFEGVPVGVNPSFTLGTPLALTDNRVGLTFNYMGSTDGVNYTNVNSLTSLLAYGSANPVSVGSAIFNGYYRNAAGETNGNFTSSLRSLGLQNQSIATRVYGFVPEPGTLTILGMGLAVLARRRRRIA